MNKRNTNLDLIRCIAVLSVLSVHFFLNNEFYSEVVYGKRMYVATIMRQSFMVCVPLFIMLTGYLMNKKQLTAQYFKGIKRVLIIYTVCTMCILGYKELYLRERITILDLIFNYTSYQQYSWYIEMYIGLFLLIPFLNVLYHGLKDKKEKKILIIVLIILTTLPSVLNTFDNTLIPVADTQIVPEWWSGIYPLLYYYMGAYLSEYKSDIKLSLGRNMILIILSIVVFGTYSYWRSYGTTFVWGTWCSYGGFTNVIDAFLIFIFLLRIDMSGWPNIVKKIIRRVSEVSLSIYLLSWIFDNYAYSILNNKVEHMLNRLGYYFVIVPFVFICSLILACMIDRGYRLVEKCHYRKREDNEKI